MKRRTFEFIVSTVGGILTIALIAAGALFFWGYHFANSNVHDQLAAQKIFFPATGSPALASPEIGPFLNKYAGQQLVDGRQAEAYADHFIAVHLKGVAGGKTYAEVSSLALASPDDPALAGQAATLFKGETLRGLLLNAFAFWKMGQLALIGSVAAFVLAAIMLVLTLLGFWHLRRVAPEAEILAPHAAGSEVHVH
jgi:hypothetical protein